MANPKQAELAARIRADRQSWHELVAAVGPDRMEEPGPMGEWSFRDLAGHLAGWRNYRAAQLEAAAGGQPAPPPPWPPELEDDDSINAWIREHDRDRSTEELLAGYDAAIERLAAAVEAIPEPMFENPAAFGFADGEEMLSGDPGVHLHEEHEPTVRAWLARRG